MNLRVSKYCKGVGNDPSPTQNKKTPRWSGVFSTKCSLNLYDFVLFFYQDFQNFFSGELLALADDAIVVKLTPGNDYYVNSGG